jgi:hypothetical protein
MSSELKIGERVKTPDGPGEIVGIYEDIRWPFTKRSHFVVQLDEGGGVWRRYYLAADLEPARPRQAKSEP